MMPKLKSILNKFHIPNWLVVVLAVVIVLRIPSFFEPYAYGDEMIYLALGEGIRQGVPLYLGLHDNKPPLLYILAAISNRLFWFKAILAFWNLATIILFWKLVSTLFPKKKLLHKISTVVFAILTTIPLLEGNIANAEIFMIGPTILAFLILFSKKSTVRNLFLSGIFFGISALFKIPAAFELPVILTYWILTKGIKAKELKESIKNFSFVFLGFAAPIVLTMIWYLFRGALPDYIKEAFLQNVGYLSTWRPATKNVPFIIRNIPLIIRGFVVLLGLGALYWKRKALPKEFIFLVVWLLFALFGVTLSERPYPHYLLQAVPALSILLGILVAEKRMIQVVSVIPLALFAFVPFYYHFWHYPSLPYYQNFLNFALGKTSKDEYFQTFNKNVPRNYRIARFIDSMTGPKDRVFVWGDSSVLYAASKRLPPIKYVADYHINEFSSKQKVAAELNLNPPKLIVVLPEGESYPELMSLVAKKYLSISEFDGAVVYNLISPTVKSYSFP